MNLNPEKMAQEALQAEVVHGAWSASWKPIESAPRDGTDFLAYEPGVGFLVARFLPIDHPDRKADAPHESWTLDCVEVSMWAELPAPPAGAENGRAVAGLAEKQAGPVACISVKPDAKRPHRPDDFCPDQRCGLIGQCFRVQVSASPPSESDKEDAERYRIWRDNAERMCPAIQFETPEWIDGFLSSAIRAKKEQAR